MQVDHMKNKGLRLDKLDVLWTDMEDHIYLMNFIIHDSICQA